MTGHPAPIRPSRRLLPAVLFVAALLPALPRAGAAQYDAPPRPAAYALTGVSVVQGDGARTEGVTVVIRDGLVAALAADAPVPADARVLEGEGLVLYPGMVDGHGGVDVSFPEPVDVEDGDDVRPWDAPRSSQGFLPHRRVADALTLTGAELDDPRKGGVVASLVHPDGRMAPGQAAVLVHRHTELPWSLVADPSAGMTLSFRGAGRLYPSQLFGVIPFLRQAFLDAGRYGVMQEAEARGRGGFVPPGWDPDHEAVLEALEGTTPVFFQADSDEDIRRALDLADEFGLDLHLVGGTEAWKLADALREREIPVWVSLDFPSPDAWDPEADTVASALTPEQAREKETLENAWANPARLADAGVTFALTSGGGDADFPEGLRTVVEHGLSPGAALAAATATPARLLGLDGLSRIRAGYPATFIVTSGDLFDEETVIHYTFVEGRLTEGVLPGAEPASDEPPAGDLTGRWTGEIGAGEQEAPVTLTLTQDEAGGLSGTMESRNGPPSTVEGRIAGRGITLTVSADGLPDDLEFTATLSEDGNTVSGSASTPFGELAFTVAREGGDWATFLLGGMR